MVIDDDPFPVDANALHGRGQTFIQHAQVLCFIERRRHHGQFHEVTRSQFLTTSASRSCSAETPTSRYHSSSRLSPSCNVMRGSYPRTVRACETSANSRLTSPGLSTSCVNGVPGWPATAATVVASSLMLISAPDPRFIV